MCACDCVCVCMLHMSVGSEMDVNFRISVVRVNSLSLSIPGFPSVDSRSHHNEFFLRLKPKHLGQIVCDKMGKNFDDG